MRRAGLISRYYDVAFLSIFVGYSYPKEVAKITVMFTTQMTTRMGRQGRLLRTGRFTFIKTNLRDKLSFS